jgi:hypothetical protein
VRRGRKATGAESRLRLSSAEVSKSMAELPKEDTFGKFGFFDHGYILGEGGK